MSALPTYAEATTECGQLKVATDVDLADLARRQGPEAVARLVWRKGHRLSFEEITERWRVIAGLPPEARAA